MPMNQKHAIIMLACCLIPLAGVAAIWLFKLPANNMVYFGLLLLCPGLHFLMMRDMFKQPHQIDPEPAPRADHCGSNLETKRQSQLSTGENKELAQ